MDEPAYTSDRTDADSYADHALTVIPGIGRIDEKRRGYIRDALGEAFHDGEHNERLRVLTILRLACERSTDPATQALLLEIAYILAPHLRPDP